LSVIAYFAKLKNLWELLGTYNVTDLCDHGRECDFYQKIITDQANTRIVEFLMGLNDDFSIIHSQLLGMKLLPSLVDAYNLIL